ncbi:MAG: SH3 domain-containing protein [Lachnospiraceae bacterium]|nr:SH3 domain-containing protein [Lachnospiraceae bacterium]
MNKRTIVTTITAMTLIASMTITAAAFTETRGTVTGTGVSIRSDASQSSERLSSVTNGNRLDVIDETTDANGTKWYKVRIDATRTGFIRSDFITLENASSSNAASTSTTSSEASSTASTSSESGSSSTGSSQTGTVNAERINVRKEASTTSDAIGALARGSKISVIGSVTGGDGRKWYQVKYSTQGQEKQGYVREDLLVVGDGASNAATSSASAATSASTATTTSTTSVTTTSGNTTASTVKELTPQAATITGSTVNVRSAAGTSNDSVAALTRNAQVTITGETTGADNNKWYRVRFTDGGSEKTGFVRADLIRIGAAATNNNAGSASTTSTPAPATTTEQPAPAPAEETPTEGEGTEHPADDAQAGAETTTTTGNMGDEYSLIRTADPSGVEAWYLYDNVNKSRAKVEDLMNAARSAGSVSDLENSNKTMRTALIILGILAVILLAAVVFLFLKMRDLLYYEDEGDDEPIVRKKEKPAPVKPERKAPEREKRPRRDREDDGMDRIRKREERRRRSVEADTADITSAVEDVKRAPKPEHAERPERPAKSRAKNFVRDDDFEFEFLDLDEDKK